MQWYPFKRILFQGAGTCAHFYCLTLQKIFPFTFLPSQWCLSLAKSVLNLFWVKMPHINGTGQLLPIKKKKITTSYTITDRRFRILRKPRMKPWVKHSWFTILRPNKVIWSSLLLPLFLTFQDQETGWLTGLHCIWTN